MQIQRLKCGKEIPSQETNINIQSSTTKKPLAEAIIKPLDNLKMRHSQKTSIEDEFIKFSMITNYMKKHFTTRENQ